jgi:hypothetical protein
VTIPGGPRFKNPVPKRVSNGYTRAMTKDAGLRIRVEHSLRDQFVETCRLHDKPAAQVLREFMREYVAVQGSRLPPPVNQLKVKVNALREPGLRNLPRI